MHGHQVLALDRQHLDNRELRVIRVRRLLKQKARAQI
jgi:hypothetical protein